MRKVTLTMENNVYEHVMFILNNIKLGGLKIEEKKDSNIKKDIKELLETKNIELFKGINDPMQWQNKQREEWQ
jgi:hypothetical protein